MVVVVLAVLVQVQSGSGGAGSDFTIVAYQGQDILGGERVNFRDVFNHNKPVVLNFWAGLCPPCRAEMPAFQRVYDDIGDQFVLVGVDVGPFVGLGSHNDARQFLQDFNISYPVAFAEDASPVRSYNVQSMPTTVFFTPDGKVFDRWIGFLTENRLRSKLQDLITASAS